MPECGCSKSEETPSCGEVSPGPGQLRERRAKNGKCHDARRKGTTMVSERKKETIISCACPGRGNENVLIYMVYQSGKRRDNRPHMLSALSPSEGRSTITQWTTELR